LSHQDLPQGSEGDSVLAAIIEATDHVDTERDALVQEAQELMNIFGAIVRKSE
jgi:hypothetical protein